ncbi:MAG: endolytic transglycosylase MltG [Gammaproteobacteria bacterium]|nr:endolytic transglycosylase MltG [Gammaproteobacteria bacterium]
MIAGALCVVVVVAAAIAAWLYYDAERHLATPLHLASSTQVFVVSPGEGVGRISRNLAAQGVAVRPIILRLDARRREIAGSIKVGEYVLRDGMTPREIFDLFVSGQVIQYAFTFPEGITFTDLKSRLGQDPVLIHTVDELSDSQILESVGSSFEHPEGLFLPETYHFTRGMRDLDILQRAYKAMDQVLASAWDQRAADLPYESPYEALIMASIIEKETGLARERPAIGGVFVRRLQKGMKLQTDPTVIYGIGPAFDGNLRRRDLENDTPYNSYTRFGLPPTPIAMPGLAAIDAALHPADGDALYFVARGDGSHQFSATLTEHNRAVREFQLKR